MSFPRYPAYKPSGVQWLGEVPEHWSIKQLKHCIHRLGSGGTPESGNPDYWADNESDDSIPWVAIGDMSSASVVYSTAKSLTQAGITVKNLEIFPAGSLLYSIYASLGKVSILGVEAAFNQAILAIVSDSDIVSQSFLKYWLENIEKHLSYYSSSNTQANLNSAKVLAYPVAVPHPDEQARIATFLDRETAKIDALIAEQQRLIELLQEKRQAVVSHAVTKGLNPNAPMKDSGVEWLGEVPEHWQTQRLKNLFSLKHGYAFDGNYFSEEGEFALMTPGNFKETGGFRRKEPEKFYTGEDIPDDFILKAGHLLVVMTEQAPGLLGTSLVVPDNQCYLHNQRLGLVTGLNEEALDKDFLYWLTNSLVMKAKVGVTATGQKVRHTSPQKILELEVCLPPLREQMLIAKTLSDSEERFEMLTTTVREAIKLLSDRRSSLISAAVTGQIDVRGLAEAEAVEQ